MSESSVGPVVSAEHGRLPWPTPAELTPQQAAVYEAIAGGPRASGPQLFQMRDDEGRLEGPFNAMLTAPTVGMPLQEVGAAIRYRSSLTDRAREVAILLVAAHRRSEFEWYAHEAIARHIGLTDDEIASIQKKEAAASFSPDECAVVEVTNRLLGGDAVDEDTITHAMGALEISGVTELVVLLGYYLTLDLLMKTWLPPLPAGIATVFAGNPGSEVEEAPFSRGAGDSSNG